MTVWFHYIGKPDNFLPPALTFGVSRNCPVNVARAMQFGDRVILLQHRGTIPAAAFAEMQINGISFFDGINVGDELIAQGRCEYHDTGGLEVERECGSFTLSGSYTIADDVTLGEIIEIAERLVTESGGSPADLRCMVWGRITRVYDVPMTVFPPVPFTRGFMRVPEGTRIGDAPAVGDAEHVINVISDYERQVVDV